ncbi:FAD-dependent oxidoreductase, partial [Burkholderia sp. SIMBA_024]
VTLLDVAPRVLMASDAAIAATVEAAFSEQGIDVRTGIETVTRLERADDDAIRLVWGEAGEERSSIFDAVIMATGWPADVEDL